MAKKRSLLALGLTALLSLGVTLGINSPAPAQVTPTTVQNQINAVPWTNGLGQVTGAQLQLIFTNLVTLQATYGAPLANPVFTGTAQAPNFVASVSVSTPSLIDSGLTGLMYANGASPVTSLGTTLPPANGGLGAASLTGILYGNGASNASSLGATLPPANGGLGAASLTGILYGNGASNASSLGATLPPANGGLGAASLTGLLVGNGASAASAIVPGAGVYTALSLAVTGTGGFVETNGATLTNPVEYGDGLFIYPVSSIAGINVFYDANLASGAISSGFGLISHVKLPGQPGDLPYGGNALVAFINPGCSNCSAYSTFTGDMDFYVIYGPTLTAQGVTLVAAAGAAAFAPAVDATVDLGTGGYRFRQMNGHALLVADAVTPNITLTSTAANVTAALIFGNNGTDTFQWTTSWTGAANAIGLYDFIGGLTTFYAVSNGAVTLSSHTTITLNPTTYLIYGAPTGTPAASLCLDASNNVIKKTTAGACI